MERSFKSGPVVAVLVVFAVLFAYVGGYFALSESQDAAIFIRSFGARWQAQLFRPLVHVESALSGKTMMLCGGGKVVAHISGWETPYPP